MNTPKTDGIQKLFWDTGNLGLEMTKHARRLETENGELLEALIRINAEVGYTASPDDWPKLHNVGLIARAILEKTK